jgi:hypothetical protein
MNNKIVLRYFTGGFITLSALSLLSVSLMAFVNPQSVMDLVQVTLPNADAYSSIRGVYGGVGATIVITLLYLCYYNHKQGILFLILFWGFYAVSRGITWLNEGALGAFGKQWMMIETTLCLLGLVLYAFNKQQKSWRIATK